MIIFYADTKPKFQIKLDASATEEVIDARSSNDAKEVSSNTAVEDIRTPTETLATSDDEDKLKKSHAINLAEIYPAYIEAAAEHNEEKVKYLLKDTIYLITTDHGGQTEFLDLMSRFLMGASLHLIFSRLTDSWDCVFQMYCTNEDGVSTEKVDSVVTLEEVTFQTLASIACMKNTSDKLTSSQYSNTALDKTNIVTKAMFVGTFRDKVSLSQFRERDQILRKKIEQTEFYHQDIVEYSSEGVLTLALDNKKGTVEEINKARQTFENCIKKNLGKVHIPCSWLMFSIVLRSKGKRTMTLEECSEIAESLNIDSSDLTNVLWFLQYRVGTLLYYPDVRGFENIVICDVKVSNTYLHYFAFDICVIDV